MVTNNLKELSKPLLIKGIPRENILYALSGSAISINFINLIFSLIIFILIFGYLTYLSKQDIDIIKIFFKKIELGKTLTLNKMGGNLYVA